MEPAAAIKTESAIPLSPGQLVWQRLKKKRVAMMGGWVLIVLYAASLFAGFVAPYSYERQDRERFFHPPTSWKIRGGWLAVPRTVSIDGKAKYQTFPEDTAPLKFFIRGEKYKLLGFIPATIHLIGTGSDQHPVYVFGTDQYGRDIFSRVLYGSQISLSIGLIGIVLSFSIGMFVGGLAGYLGGRVDGVAMRFAELIMSVPALYLIMAMRQVFPASLSATQAYFLIVVILSFVGCARAAIRARRPFAGPDYDQDYFETYSAQHVLLRHRRGDVERAVLHPRRSRAQLPERGRAGTGCELGQHAQRGAEHGVFAEPSMAAGARRGHLHHGSRF
jgi:ABC-type dipeptide/oligopeptide/nickel transport system permease subunit